MHKEENDNVKIEENEMDLDDNKRFLGYYEKLREGIRKKLNKVEKKLGKKGVDIILLAPDLFILLTRLIRDVRVDMKKKITLGAVIAYWILPADLLPEVIVGPVGYLDDILITLYVLDALFTDTDLEVLLDNWPGDPEVMKNINLYAQKVKNLLRAVGGNLEEKATQLADSILKGGRKEE